MMLAVPQQNWYRCNWFWEGVRVGGKYDTTFPIIIDSNLDHVGLGLIQLASSPQIISVTQIRRVDEFCMHNPITTCSPLVLNVNGVSVNSADLNPT
jgi:hypothetical protein